MLVRIIILIILFIAYIIIRHKCRKNKEFILNKIKEIENNL
jgi:hypothetical protein